MCVCVCVCDVLQPVPEELQNGGGFGYVVAFRPQGSTGWMQAAVPSAEASRYVFKNESIPPFSPFHVKVGVYNNRGEGPFGHITTIYSAEEGNIINRHRFITTFSVSLYSEVNRRTQHWLCVMYHHCGAQ